MTDLYSPAPNTVAYVLPQDRPFVAPIATALGQLLEPSPGHVLDLDAVRDAVLAAGVRTVPYGTLKRVLRASGVPVVSEGSRNMLVRNVRFADGTQR